MKKNLLMAAALLMSASAFAANAQIVTHEIAQGADCEVFLAPYVDSALKEMTSQVVLDAGCSALPSSNQIALSARLTEVASGMKMGETLLLAAPASYGVVFTDGSISDEGVHHHIRQVLTKIGNSRDSSFIINNLSELKEVMRATFVPTRGGLKLVIDERALRDGQHVWCITPSGVIATVYLSEENCLLALRHAGFTCEEIKRPCFSGKVKYDQWQQASGKSLGNAYMSNHPFTLYYSVKRA